MGAWRYNYLVALYSIRFTLWKKTFSTQQEVQFISIAVSDTEEKETSCCKSKPNFPVMQPESYALGLTTFKHKPLLLMRNQREEQEDTSAIFSTSSLFLHDYPWPRLSIEQSIITYAT